MADLDTQACAETRDMRKGAVESNVPEISLEEWAHNSWVIATINTLER